MTTVCSRLSTYNSNLNYHQEEHKQGTEVDFRRLDSKLTAECWRHNIPDWVARCMSEMMSDGRKGNKALRFQRTALSADSDMFFARYPLFPEQRYQYVFSLRLPVSEVWLCGPVLPSVEVEVEDSYSFPNCMYPKVKVHN